MMDHSVYVLSVSEFAPDTFRIVVERPHGYRARAGQAAEIAIDEDGWWDQPRPFTFRQAEDPECLEFVVRAYADADPVMARLATLRRGDRLALGDPMAESMPNVFFGGWRRPSVIAAQAAQAARDAEAARPQAVAA